MDICKAFGICRADRKPFGGLFALAVRSAVLQPVPVGLHLLQLLMQLQVHVRRGRLRRQGDAIHRLMRGTSGAGSCRHNGGELRWDTQITNSTARQTMPAAISKEFAPSQLVIPSHPSHREPSWALRCPVRKTTSVNNTGMLDMQNQSVEGHKRTEETVPMALHWTLKSEISIKRGATSMVCRTLTMRNIWSKITEIYFHNNRVKVRH